MPFLTGLGNALQSLDCAILSSADYLYGASGQLGGLDAGTSGRVIAGLRRLRGCNPDNDPPEPSGGFTGGQCEGSYDLSYGTFLITIQNGPQPQFTATQTITGGVFAANVSGPILSMQTFFDLDQGFGPRRVGVRVITRTSDLTYTITGPVGGPDDFIASAPISYSVARTDGPDNCGSPPPQFPPPINITFNVPITYTDEGDNIINIDVPIEIKPFNVNFNGDLSFPITFSLGGVDFSGDFSLTPTFNLNVSGPTFSPIDTDLPEGDPDTGPQVDLEPRGSKVQGVLVTARVSPNTEVSSYDVSGMPDIFVPRLGSVKFAYSFGARTVWSNDIDVKGTNVFIPCPFSQGADAVVAAPREGVSFTIAELRGPPIATVADLPRGSA